MDRTDFIPLQSVKEATRLLKKGPGAFFMAGGTDLLVLKRDRVIKPESMLYLKTIPGLSKIRRAKGGGLSIGALTTLDTVAQDPSVRKHYPILARAAAAVASPQVRHKATLGGNICLNSRCWFYNRSPFWRAEYPECRKASGKNKCYVVPSSRRGCFALQSGDTVGPLVALGAKLQLVSGEKRRVMDIEDFFLGDGIRYLALKPGEVLTEVLLPPPAGKGVFIKFRPQNNLDFATFTLSLIFPGKKGGVRIVAACVASKPLRARKAEVMLEQGASPQDVVEEAMKELPLVSFVRGSVEFKKQVLAAYMTEALTGSKAELTR
jgi:4-hydroxybenzoyl-CoA reductase subunit beta